MSPGGEIRRAFRAEGRKLRAQLGLRVLALVCGLGPLLFGAVLSAQSGVPADTLLGVWVHSSGYAVTLVVLGFAGYLGFPLLAGIVAGDVFSSEDRYDTWKSIVTRSSRRGALVAGKVLAALLHAGALAGLVAVSSLVAGLLFTGDEPLVGLGGGTTGAGQSVWLVLLSWLVSIPALMAFTSFALLLSALTRSGIVGVIGPVLAALAMQLLTLTGGGTVLHTLLPTSAFDGWHGLLASPRFYGPLVAGVLVSFAWMGACLLALFAIHSRRDFAGTPAARGRGWLFAARPVLVVLAVIAVMAAISDSGPSAITPLRIEASIAPAFNRLTRLQQQELGRSVPAGSPLQLRTSCRRRGGSTTGPGDDWSCTLDVVGAPSGPEPLQLTAVTYDLSVKSNGCYKADAPPSFVGPQTMTDARHRRIVNPLFTIYGCFDTLGHAPRCPSGVCVSAAGSHGAAPATPGGAPGAQGGSGTGGGASPGRKALEEAERSSGRGVIEETEASRRALEGQPPKPVK